MTNEQLRAVLAANIKAKRHTLGYSQAAVAEKADLSVQYVADVEACRSWASDKTLVKIAMALYCDVYELFIPENNAARKTRYHDAASAVLREKSREIHKMIDCALKDALDSILASADDD